MSHPNHTPCDTCGERTYVHVNPSGARLRLHVAPRDGLPCSAIEVLTSTPTPQLPRLIAVGGLWCVDYLGTPECDEIRALFGGAILPTPYGIDVARADVVACLLRAPHGGTRVQAEG